MTAEAKHTPGPWKARKATASVPTFHVRGGTGTVASVYGKTIERTEANALLIAAAPEMVVALQVAKKHYRLAINALGRSYRVGKGTATAQKHRADYERHVEIAEQAIDAAIAKAEGR